MTDLMTQILIYMSCTLVLGVVLGWLLRGDGKSGELESVNSEVNFWKSSLEQARAEREGDLHKIKALTAEKENLKKRLAAKKG